MTMPPKPCLLVVDDEPEVCNSVYHLLHRTYEILRAHSAAEAVALMEQHDVQIIMTDQRMPDVTGVEMLTRLKPSYPEAVRILFTGFADINSVIAAINQGHVFRYLSKPWQPEELEAVVADALAEYNRIVQHTRELAECRQTNAQLKADLHAVQTELARLNRENPPK
ncbi:MAG: response regulator [Isosphaeraceae bacterium]